MLTMNLLTVLAGICCLATCAIALIPYGPSHQHEVIDGPAFPETNLDDAEYRIHFKERDTNPNLSCKTRQAFLQSKTNALTETDDTVHLKLQNYDPRPFNWIEVSNWTLHEYGERIRKYRETVNNTEFNSKTVKPSEYIYLESLLLSPRTNTGSVYSICKSLLANTSKSIIGMISWESETPSCQVSSNGQLMNLPNYTVLMNIYNVKFTWVNVTTWQDIPRTADLFIAELPYNTSTNQSSLDPEKRYIGRLLSPGREPIIIDVPKGKEEMLLPIEGVEVQRQVLVPVDLSYLSKFESLLCQAATGAFNRSQYREEMLLLAKMAPEQGEKWKKLEKAIGEATVFQKIEEKASLSWEYLRSGGNPAGTVFVGKDGRGDEIHICRYRCRGSRCGGYNYTSANGSVIYRSVDKVLGTFSPNKRSCIIGLKHILVFGHSDTLVNPLGVKVSWTPATALSTSNGTVVTSEANGETYAIGRIFRPGEYICQGDTVGHVNLSSKTILLSDGSIFTWENGQENVDILVIHE